MPKIEDGILNGIIDKMKNILHIQKGSLTSGKNEAIIDYDEKFGFKKIEGVHTQEEDLKNTNPKYSTGQEEYCKNCQRCVNTYEARRRGYDVEALPRILDGTDKLPHMKDKKNGWTAVYKNPMLIHCGADTQDEMVDNVDEVIKSFGVNSRAIIRVQWKSHGGHVFIAETIEGATRFIDPQTNRVDVKYMLLRAKPVSVYVMRVDNLNFTDKIKECCKEAGT